NVAPAAILTTDTHLAGNLRLQFPGVPVVAETYSEVAPHPAWDPRAPLLLVWRNKEGSEPAVPAGLAAFAASFVSSTKPSAPTVHIVALPYHYGDAEAHYSFGYAWLYPQAE
ncbi:MAG TPA: hypothetical protein VM468_10010, partial [Mycoplana sp.]|nr:hypothetical protein [Mycoplana sp.]